MKTALSIVLICAFLFSFAACTKTRSGAPKDTTSITSSAPNGTENITPSSTATTVSSTTSDTDSDKNTSSKNESSNIASSTPNESAESATSSEPAHTHVFVSDNCTTVKTCSCGATNGEYGHSYYVTDDRYISVACENCGFIPLTSYNTGGHYKFITLSDDGAVLKMYDLHWSAVTPFAVIFEDEFVETDSSSLDPDDYRYEHEGKTYVFNGNYKELSGDRFYVTESTLAFHPFNDATYLKFSYANDTFTVIESNYASLPEGSEFVLYQKN